MEVVITQPSAAPVIQALRSIGYNASTAIADLVDNCLDAKADNININFAYDQIDSMITIIDNGSGMNEEMLQTAMNIGSKDPRNKRDANELGRFGMGLKTASFSLGKRLSVLTKHEGVYYERCWDLDHVSSCNEWQLFTHIPYDVKDKMGEIIGENGTIVCIDKLDRFMGHGRSIIRENTFYNKVARVNRHLEFVFHSIIENSSTGMFINSKKIVPWNPFMISHESTIEGEMQVIKINDHKIRVKYYILPHASNLSEPEYKKAGGYKGWRDHQGLYIYRENRLLYFGDWMGLFQKDAASQLARIRIDIPNAADSDWQVDIKKSGINLPEEAKKRLETISGIARKVSRDIFYFRTQTPGGGSVSSKGSLNTWEQSGREDGPQFILNRNHPILSEILKNVDEKNAKLLNLYLKFVQLGSPSNIIDSPKVPEEMLQEVSDADKELVIQLASTMLSIGIADNEEQLLNTLITQPAFDSINRITLKTILLEAELID